MRVARSQTPWKILLLILVLLSLALYFRGLGDHGLLEPDEGRYSEIPREMMESGDFVTPRLNYVKYFEKPVLSYWLTAGAFALFGENEFAGRFWPALLALGGALFTWMLARFLYGRETALLSSVILITSLIYFAIGQINITDMPLSFFLTMAMTGFYLGLEKDRRYYLLLYAGMALAILTKGLIGIVLPGGIIFWYMILTRKWRIPRSALYLPGIILFFALVLPWFVEVCRRNDDFFYFFFVQEHFLRYATKMHGRYEPFWFFIPILLAGLFPWTGLLPGALRSAKPASWRALKERPQPELFLFLWFAVIFLFFSLSSSKLVPYIVPVFPPLAILMGRLLARLVTEKEAAGTRRFLLWSSAALLPFIAALLVYPFFNDRLPADRLLPYGIPLALGLSTFLGAGWYFYRRRQFRALALFLCLLAFANMFAFKRLFTLYDTLLTARQLSGEIAALQREGDIVAQYANYDQGLPFYLKGRIVLIDYLGELAFGAARETDPTWFLKGSEMKALWRGDKRVILVIDRDRREQAADLLGLPSLEPAAETAERLVFVNKP